MFKHHAQAYLNNVKSLVIILKFKRVFSDIDCNFWNRGILRALLNNKRTFWICAQVILSPFHTLFVLPQTGICTWLVTKRVRRASLYFQHYFVNAQKQWDFPIRKLLKKCQWPCRFKFSKLKDIIVSEHVLANLL